MNPKISFLGASREVGRSAFLIRSENANTLLDCGIKVRDEEEFPLLDKGDCKRLDEVILSHAHLDHSGYLPALYANGFSKSVILTKPTRDLIQLLLADYLRLNKNFSPYSQEDVDSLLNKTRISEIHEKIKLKESEMRLYPAGHILGAGMTELDYEGKKVLYTGDLNLSQSRLIDGAETGMGADTLIIESTYGAREDKHKSVKQAGKILVDSINETLTKGGKVIIPTFAIGRGQEVLFTLESYLRSGALEECSIYLDGMVNKALRIYRHNAIYLKDEIKKRILTSDDDPFKSYYYKVPQTKDRSDVLSDERAVILATSGMLNGGPVLTYLEKLGGDENNKIILVGYQSEGTKGRKLLEGAKELEINGNAIQISLEVCQAPFSAHSDHDELLRFVKNIKGLEKVFIVHGEGDKQTELAEDIEKYGLSQKRKGKHGIQAIIPKLGEEEKLF